MEHSSLNRIGNVKANGIHLFIELLTKRCVPDDLWRDSYFRIKYAVRTFIHPLLTLKILNKIAAEPIWQEAFTVQTKLPNKIHKPYLYADLPPALRVSALIDHYTFVENIENTALKNAFISARGRVVSSFYGKEGEAFTVKMGSIGQSEREGETNMFLYMEETKLAALTFCVVNRPQGTVLIVGGFQGANRSTPHEVIKQATKSCYGLFPKRLLLESLQRIAAQAGIQHILAVSNAGHVFHSLRYRHRKKNTFVASYDEFWDSIGANRYSSALYSIPQTIPRKEMEDLPSKKRSEYRKRYTLLDEMNSSTESLLCSIPQNIE
ncbi:VirK/YbjX family protein [Acerihabitans sp. TG2]|uniref:VirK/YbjX family protein n=1 Tax=Acerihabitans sp. TG2 TaxID=3096008 RepID=UPI002B2311D2|nr:VirK/YbjX family protein [Acerihabitans sp. TG2]MEA9390627.1 VirK/YbjX family protein [Acerihabitans sp. TG2]